MKDVSGRRTLCITGSVCPAASAALCTAAISVPCATISVRSLFHATHLPANSMGAGFGAPGMGVVLFVVIILTLRFHCTVHSLSAQIRAHGVPIDFDAQAGPVGHG